MQIVNFTGNEKTVQKVVLDNGITLIGIENQTADLIAGRLFFKGTGAMWESPQKSGLFHLLATVITKGTKHLSAQEIAEQIESIGASLGADASSDYFVLSLKTVAADFAQMLKLAGEILRSQRFQKQKSSEKNKLLVKIFALNWSNLLMLLSINCARLCIPIIPTDSRFWEQKKP